MDEPELTKKSTKHRSIKRIKRALRKPDPFLAFFYLKGVHISSFIELDDEIMSKLLEFMKSFTQSDVFIRNDFENFMSRFLKKITSKSLELHIRCISMLKLTESNSLNGEGSDLEFYRNTYGYGKIYAIFKGQIKHLFIDGTEPKFLLCLMKLLDNHRLVYKNLLPVIEKLGMFLDQHIVDKTVVECCIALWCAGKTCPELLSSVFVASLLTYLIGILMDTQNFIFIGFSESKIIINTVETLAGILANSTEQTDTNVRKLSMGLFRLLAENIREYRHSTVYEEAMVVLSATACLESVFKLFLKAGNRNIDFFDADLLSFVVLERATKGKEQKSHSLPSGYVSGKKRATGQKLYLEFERPFKHHYNAQCQALRDDFIVSKYKFLDLFWNLTNTFERVEFFNDLCKIEASHKLFSVLNNLKNSVEWSDLVVFACNAPKKENYIPFIFDTEYIKRKEHHMFLNMFLSSLVSMPQEENTIKSHAKHNGSQQELIYFTSHAIHSRLMSLTSKLYLIDLDKDDNFAKKRREIILKFIASLGKDEMKEDEGGTRETALQRSKEVQISIDQKELGGNLTERLKTVEIKEVVNKDKIAGEEDNVKSTLKAVRLVESHEIEEFVQSLIDHLEYLHYNIVPLLMILVYKKISLDLLKRFLECLNTKLNENKGYFLGQESVVCIFAIFCAIYEYSYFESHKIQSDKDLYIAVLCTRITGSSQNISKIKTDAFNVLIELDEPSFTMAKEIFHMSDSKNSYVAEFQKILSIIKDEDQAQRFNIK